MKGIDWRTHFIELLVVFIGITAAFLLNNWRENRQEKKLALKYYNSLLKDLTSDADSFDGLLEFSEEQDSTLTNFISLYQANNFSEEFIPDVLQVLVSLSQFSPELATYETIKYSGNVDIFSDYELHEEISLYYSKIDEVMLKQQLQLDYMNNYCIPYIYKNVNILSGQLLPEASMDTEFVNVAVGYLAMVQQSKNAYSDLMEDNNSLKLKLAQKISNQ